MRRPPTRARCRPEELNQMSERGVPVMQALAKTLGRNDAGNPGHGIQGAAVVCVAWMRRWRRCRTEGGKYFGSDGKAEPESGRALVDG